jgi:glycerol-3-phosphate acyltransferase PlsY
MLIIKLLILFVISYLLGAIPTAYLITKIVIKKDIRTLGSGNVGATNVYRSVGKFSAILTLIIDILKGYFAVKLAFYLLPDSLVLAIFFGIVAILAHSYSVFLNWKGGKSVATSLGVFIALAGPAMFITVIIFIATLGLFGYISVASIISAIFLPISIYSLEYNHIIFYTSIIASLFIIYRHKENIKRLIAGTEQKITQK